MECLDCLADLDHCHGTLIQHEDTFAECTDPGCSHLDVVRHRLTLACAEIGCACTATLEIVEFAKAS
ncbi:MAG TPA: hypothetical protein VJ870_15590 [Amycolatopsis sp.]|nr:hypothetical protein [Amycolatopsis sp.]